jgi:hypothetical protein
MPGAGQPNPRKEPAVTYRANCPPMSGVLTFTTQARQYGDAVVEPGGITYYCGNLPDKPGAPFRWVDCLLRWDEAGNLAGILNHYPQDMPPFERAGNCTVFVRDDCTRQGIATELWDEAVRRYGVTLEGQDFTPQGARLANALAERDARHLA